MLKRKNKGVRNFKIETDNKDLLGIYEYLSRKKKSNFTTQTECNELIYIFCKHRLKIEDSLPVCARMVQYNWNSFIEFTEVVKEITND